MARSDTTFRLFVAAYPTEPARAALAASLRDHPRRTEWPPHRPVAPDQLHLTLQFIGDRREQELAQVESSIAGSIAGLPAVVLTPRRLLSLPRRGPARLLAIETDAPPALLEIHRRLAHRLARNPRKDPVEGFLPHITLCRFSSPVPGLAVDEVLNAEPMAIDRVSLVRSVLHPAGAEHRVLREFPLGDGRSPSGGSGGAGPG